MSMLRVAIITVCLGLCAASVSAQPAWRVSSADGKASLNFGFLAQPQIEAVTTPDGEETSRYLMLRRMRFLLGGSVTDRVTFFIDTDLPNLGKPDGTGRKNEGSMFLQDIVLTYAAAKNLYIDGGLLIVPVGHHATQSAANLLGVDYGAFSFTHSDPTNSRTGRDYGLQARGYVADNHVEFRAGLFSGARNGTSTSPFRYTLRAVWYPLQADTGFFYTGTSLGAKRVISLGASLDHQDDYNAMGVDFYVDHPLAGGKHAFTGQVNYTRYDGGTTFNQLPEQDVWFVEAGFFDQATRLGPFLQWANRNPNLTGLADESRVIGGLAYWAQGHRLNLKLGVGRVSRQGSDARTQVVLQAQVFVF